MVSIETRLVDESVKETRERLNIVLKNAYNISDPTYMKAVDDNREIYCLIKYIERLESIIKGE